MRDFALEVSFSKWEFDVRYNMAASDAQSLSLTELLALATPTQRAAFENVGLGYIETFGTPDLRRAIAATYDTIDDQHVLCFAGTEEAIYVTARVLLEPGDHAVVFTPNDQAAETVPLDPDRGWMPDIDRFMASLRPTTRMVSMNFPNNPTGCIISRADFDAILDACSRRGIWLFCDEVYRNMERDVAMRLPPIADVYERGISLNVMSKAYGLAGLRVGWVACQNRDVLVRFERYKQYLSICNAAPSEMLATIALGAAKRILARNRAIVDTNLGAVSAFFAAFPKLFEWHVPDGGCTGFPRYTGADGVEAFARELVEETGVLVLPASVYRSDIGCVASDRFRIGFGRTFVPEALGVVGAWLETRSTQQLAT